MGYFTVRIAPDIVDGDISKIIAANKTDAPFADGDIVFDWQPLQVPKGTNKLVSISGYIMGEDGTTQTNTDLSFVFAKSVNNVAPTTLGEENEAQTACFELPLHYIGAVKIEGTGSPIVGPRFGDVFSTGYEGGNNGHTCNLVLEGEPESGQNVGYDVIYVAMFTKGALDFSTGVTSGAVSADSATDITVSAVDARACFQEGDIVYVHDQDTALGVVSSVPDATSLILTANNAVAIENTDEIMNATPIKVVFGFEN
tara:strand:- start:304 stop:1071 length:768 start_codon:yes stop_codon:yes gene_type:complete